MNRCNFWSKVRDLKWVILGNIFIFVPFLKLNQLPLLESIKSPLIFHILFFWFSFVWWCSWPFGFWVSVLWLLLNYLLISLTFFRQKGKKKKHLPSLSIGAKFSFSGKGKGEIKKQDDSPITIHFGLFLEKIYQLLTNYLFNLFIEFDIRNQ